MVAFSLRARGLKITDMRTAQHVQFTLRDNSLVKLAILFFVLRYSINIYENLSSLSAQFSSCNKISEKESR